MSYLGLWDRTALSDDKLAVFVLNVGHGDSIVIRFPVFGGKVVCGVVDCYNAKKTTDVLKKLNTNSIAFICATHPHLDHIVGLQNVIEWCGSSGVSIPVDQFWDSGFRHVSKTHYDLIRCLQGLPEISFLRIASGFETTINKVRVLALAPSIRLKNKYDTFGTEINNASIVLKLEYPPKDVALYAQKPDTVTDEELSEEERLKQNSMILGGDAQFDSWAHLVQEFPQQTRNKIDNRGQMIGWQSLRTVTHKPIYSQVIKVPHHMSKNGISFEVLNNIHPKYALVSCSNSHKHNCPHPLTKDAANEVDGCKTFFTGNKTAVKRSGTIAVLFQGDGKDPEVYDFKEPTNQMVPI